MLGQNLTKGNIRRELWSLAWPLILSVFFYSLYNIVDTFWVSRISDEAIAAVSISQVVLFIMVALSMGIAIGSGVITAMNIGAGKKQEAERVLGQSFVLAGIIALFFTGFALIFRNQLLSFAGASGAIFDPALEYFTVTSAGAIFLFLLMSIIFAFNSQGDTFTLTKLLIVSTIVNVVLDPILIFGLFGFPSLGISGAAIATLFSQFVFIIIALKSLNNPKRNIRFHLKNLTIKLESVKKVFKIGFPASLTQVLNPISQATLLYILTLGFMEAGAIAYSIGFRIEFFAYLPAIGFGFGATALIGQNIGAGNLERARKSYKIALKYSFLSAASVGLLSMLIANFFVGIFTKDPIITSYTTSYILIVGLSYGFLAASMVEANAFQSIGKSWPGFWIVVIRLLVITIPLSVVFTIKLELPIIFIWISMLIGNISASIFGYVWLEKTLNNLDINKVPIHK